MAEPERKRTDGLTVLLYIILIVAGGLLTWMGVQSYYDKGDPMLMALGVVAVIFAVGMFPIASALSRGTGGDSDSAQLIELMQSMNDRLLISDTAKRIAFRENDRSALREAIRNDINAGDYEAALVLVDEMSRIYGYREEAESFRSEILAARDDEVRRKVTEAIANVDGLIEKADWTSAVREAGKIQRLYSEWQDSRGLLKRVQQARDDYKGQLMMRFSEAYKRNDAEESWQLLKELDDYIGTDEAGPLAEMAREVIAKKRENLGMQFKLTVQEQEWSQALTVGEQIIAEFPNSKMADEVRNMMNVLRERATVTTAETQTTAWNWSQGTGT